MVELGMIDAVTSLLDGLLAIADAGSGKASQKAKAQISAFQKGYPRVIEIVRAAIAITGEAEGEERVIRWMLANSFSSLSPMQVAERIEAGEVLEIVDGRAALRDPGGQTYLGEVVA